MPLQTALGARVREVAPFSLPPLDRPGEWLFTLLKGKLETHRLAKRDKHSQCDAYYRETKKALKKLMTATQYIEWQLPRVTLNKQLKNKIPKRDSPSVAPVLGVMVIST